MWPLLKQNIRHIIRTRLLIVLLSFSFLVQFFGLKTLHFMTLQFQGIVSRIEGDNALFAALFFQLFTGAFIAAAYGIWMVPYAHQGMRSSLTFTLPVSKWKFPLGYALTMLGLLVLQHLVMLLSFGLNFGFEMFRDPAFPWGGVMMCLLIETLAFEVCMFAFAISSMTFGQVPTFFLGAAVIFFLQLTGVILKWDLEKLGGEPIQSLYWARFLYGKLPPVGDIAFDLRKAFLKPAFDQPHFWLWIVWLVLLVAWFRFKLRYPSRSRAGEA
jgi:hypothetical protein